jgi:hypothetical protein
MLIQLTGQDNKPVLVNTDHILGVYPEPTSTAKAAIRINGRDGLLRVKESLEGILQIEERRAQDLKRRGIDELVRTIQNLKT